MEQYKKEKKLKDVNGASLWSVKDRSDLMIKEYSSAIEAKKATEILEIIASKQDPILGLPTSLKERVGSLVVFYGCEEEVAVVTCRGAEIKMTEEISKAYASYYKVSIQKNSELIINFFKEKYGGLVNFVEIVFGLDEYDSLRIMEINTTFSRKNGDHNPQSLAEKRPEEVNK